MVQIQLLLLLAASCIVLASGGPIDTVPEDEFCEPVFSVVGRHYTPRTKCVRDGEKTRARQTQFLKKYLDEIGTNDCERNEELTSILNVLSQADAQLFETVELKCTACTAAVQLMRFMYATNFTTEDIMRIAQGLCIDLNILYPYMCKGVINLYGEAIGEIMQKSPHDPMTFCAMLFNGVCFENATDNIKWNVKLPSIPKPPVLQLKEPAAGKPKLKVLHISDTHWDMRYAENTPSECRFELCCRNDSVALPGNTEKSGKWGGWKCDIPESTFDSFLDELAKEHKDAAYIIWTGDIPAHDLWEQNVQNNYQVLDETVRKLKKAFPSTPIYPALGNHESIPPNLYPAKNQTPDDPLLWLYRKLNAEWQSWLPGNQSATILRGGFYSVLVRPKLRVISMNMNYCYTMNWWLLLNDVDPERELKWLVEELTKAEEKGEKVHIIGHVPSGYNECLKSWQTNFYKIVNRFENTVAGQFFGHTHTDEIEIFYDMKNQSRPFGIGYLAPSVTTYTYLNPGYRVYYVDGDYEGTTRYVLDHETWIMDLQKSNEEGKAYWMKYYTAKDAYNMTSLFPQNWHELYERMKKDDKVMDVYLRHYWKGSPKQPPTSKKTRLATLCNIRSCVQYGKPKL